MCHAQGDRKAGADRLLFSKEAGLFTHPPAPGPFRGGPVPKERALVPDAYFFGCVLVPVRGGNHLATAMPHLGCFSLPQAGPCHAHAYLHGGTTKVLAVASGDSR